MTRTEVRQLQEQLFPGDGESPKPTLCDICLDVRMSLNGSADPWEPSLVVATRDLLDKVLETWIIGREEDWGMDIAVRLLVLSTRNYINHYLDRGEVV